VLADIGNGVGIVAQGPDNSLDYYWATNGTSTWHPELVGGYNTTYAAPSIAPDGNSAVVAAEGPSNSLDFYWQQDGTTPWNPESVAGAGTTYSAPAITGNDNSANIAVEGPNNTLSFYWQTNGTTPWNLSIPNPPEGSQAYGVPSITTFSDHLGDGVHVVTPNFFGDPYSYTDYNGNSIWDLVSANANVDSDVAVTENNGSENLAYFGFSDGSEGNLEFAWADSAGQFHQEVVAPAGVN
jgi:hypothetical protein